jgi:hypothetical protein
MQFNFGAGNLFAIPNNTTPPTPIRIGGLQNASVEFASSVKDAVGQYQYALAGGRGQSKVTGKAKALQVSANAYNSLYFNQTVVAGQTLPAIDEIGAVPSATPYTYSAVNKSTWTQDLGVIYANTGIPFKCVASNPTQGQYTVSAGVYTFAAADAGVSIDLCYMYTVTTGYTITLNNQLMGVAPMFMAVFSGTFQGNTKTIVLNNVLVDKLTPFDTKLEDFDLLDVSYTGYVNAGNALGLISTSQ